MIACGVEVGVQETAMILNKTEKKMTVVMVREPSAETTASNMCGPKLHLYQISL